MVLLSEKNLSKWKDFFLERNYPDSVDRQVEIIPISQFHSIPLHNTFYGIWLASPSNQLRFYKSYGDISTTP